jgi:hypothetical protein
MKQNLKKLKTKKWFDAPEEKKVKNLSKSNQKKTGKLDKSNPKKM